MFITVFSRSFPLNHHYLCRVCVRTRGRTCVCSIDSVVSPWIMVHQAPLSMEFSQEEYWSGLPCPPPGDLPDPGMRPMSPVSPALQADSLLLKPWVLSIPFKPHHSPVKYRLVSSFSDK